MLKAVLTRLRRSGTETDGESESGAAKGAIDWRGQSGRRYGYWIYAADARFNEHRPANYIFVRRTDDGAWLPLFVGQCGDLAMPLLEGHFQEHKIEQAGVTHVHIHFSSHDLHKRMAEEDDLRRRHNPPCNRL